MKLFAALLMVPCVCLSARAQLDPAPGPSTDDGILIQPFSSRSAFETGWATSSLQDYNLSHSLPAPSNGVADGYGRTWTSTAPDFSLLKASGGTLRLIALGAGPAWLTNIGYSYSGLPNDPGNSFTLTYSDHSDSPSAFGFGDTVDLSLLPHDLATLDLWFNSANGTDTLFHPENSIGAAAQILWTATPLSISTFVEGEGLEDVNTWIVSVTQPSQNGDDAFRFAVQDFVVSGVVVAEDPPAAVPEPATYGVAALALLGGLAWRRRRR